MVAYRALAVVLSDCARCGAPFSQAVSSPDAIQTKCPSCRRNWRLYLLPDVRSRPQPPPDVCA